MASETTKSQRYLDNGSGNLAPIVANTDSTGALIDPAKDQTLQSSNAKLDTLHADLQALAGEEGALGAQEDAAWSGSGAASIVAILKAAWSKIEAVRSLLAGTLTVTQAFSASGNTPVAATFAATGQSSSFVPIAGREFNISLWGTFVASVRMERSFDGGATFLPITAAGYQLYAWTGPASESAEESEFGVAYRLNCTAYTSGTVNYRISQ